MLSGTVQSCDNALAQLAEVGDIHVKLGLSCPLFFEMTRYSKRLLKAFGGGDTHTLPARILIQKSLLSVSISLFT